MASQVNNENQNKEISFSNNEVCNSPKIQKGASNKKLFVHESIKS